jgi:hypothetical protein
MQKQPEDGGEGTLGCLALMLVAVIAIGATIYGVFFWIPMT